MDNFYQNDLHCGVVKMMPVVTILKNVANILYLHSFTTLVLSFCVRLDPFPCIRGVYNQKLIPTIISKIYWEFLILGKIPPFPPQIKAEKVCYYCIGCVPPWGHVLCNRTSICKCWQHWFGVWGNGWGRKGGKITYFWENSQILWKWLSLNRKTTLTLHTRKLTLITEP